MSLVDDPRVLEIWSGAVGHGDARDPASYLGRRFWELGLSELAAGHTSRDMHSGDMVRFSALELAYVGRKIIVWPNDTDGDLQSVPALDAPKGPSLSDSDRAILRTAWELMSEIFASALPPGLSPPALCGRDRGAQVSRLPGRPESDPEPPDGLVRALGSPGVRGRPRTSRHDRLTQHALHPGRACVDLCARRRAAGGETGGRGAVAPRTARRRGRATCRRREVHQRPREQTQRAQDGLP